VSIESSEDSFIRKNSDGDSFKMRPVPVVELETNKIPSAYEVIDMHLVGFILWVYGKNAFPS
jgi:hypothetical protein